MILVDAEGTIVLANEHTFTLFGYPPGWLTGKPGTLLMPQRYRGPHAGHRKGFFRSPHFQEMGKGFDVNVCAADGTEFLVEVSLNPYAGQSASYTLATIRATPMRKATETRVKHLNRILGDAKPNPCADRAGAGPEEKNIP